MPVTIENIDKALIEVNRFIRKADIAKKALHMNPTLWTNPKETGAVKRASMDLTRALVDIRR